MASSLISQVTLIHSVFLLPLGLCMWAVFAFLKHLYTTFYGPLSRVPGPRWRAFTIIPHLKAMWMGNEATSVVDLHEEYGPTVRLAPDLVAFIGNAHTWKTIYASKSQGVSNFEKDVIFYDPPFNEVPGPFGSGDTVSLRMRKTMAPAFSDSGLKQYEPRFKAWCGALATRLDQHAMDGTPSDMVKLFNCTTFDVMSDMLLSEPLHLLEKGDYVPFVRLIFTILRHVTRLKTVRLFYRPIAKPLHRLLMSIPSVRAHAERHHKFITTRVDERLAKSPEQPDIWSLVTAETSSASMISSEERYSIANELMIAGTETSATVLSGCLYHLLRNPAWLSALTQDIRANYGPDTEGGPDKITMASLQANKLLEAILKESMRLYPPVPIGFPRFVPRGGAQLDNHYLPEGTRVVIYHLATYRSSDLWHEPDTFHPERWLGDEKFRHDHLEAFEPFSTGPRGCSGKNFAWNEMRLILATTLLKFDLKLREESQTWGENQKVFLVWEKPALMVDVKKAAAPAAKV